MSIPFLKSRQNSASLFKIYSALTFGLFAYSLSSCALANNQASNQDFSIENKTARAASSVPELSNPAPGSILKGQNVTFNWVRNGAAVEDWYFRAGNAQNPIAYEDSRITNVATTSHIVRGLPTDGRKIHIEFSYRLPSGSWVKTNHIYTASSSTSSASSSTSSANSSTSPTIIANGTTIDFNAAAANVEVPAGIPAAGSDTEYGVTYVNGACPGIPRSFRSKTFVSTAQGLKQAVANAQPGDAVVIRNGTYNWTNQVPASSQFSRAADHPLELTGSGTATNPIYILPESLHGVVFAGSRVDWVLSGQNIVIAGFRFVSDGSFYVLNSDNRIACNLFSNSSSKYITVENRDAHRTTIDNNDFNGSRFNAILLWRCNPVLSHCLSNSKGAHIHHNTFRNKAYSGGQNGHEAIVLGLNYSPISEVRTYNPDGENMEAIVENNLFDGWNGEHELITIKSSKNILRNNCIINSPNANFVLRNGNDNLITGNWMENASGGIEISGRRNTIVYNYKGRKSGDRFGFRFHSGEQYLPSFLPGQNFENLYGYIDASDNTLRYNVFSGIQQLVDTRNQIGHIFRDFPSGNFVADNLIYTDHYSGTATSGGYHNADGKMSESHYRSINNWGRNTIIQGNNLPASQCGNPNLFRGPGPGSYDTRNNLLGGTTRISAPSWW